MLLKSKCSLNQKTPPTAECALVARGRCASSSMPPSGGVKRADMENESVRNISNRKRGNYRRLSGERTGAGAQ